MTPRDRAEALVRELEIDPARDFDELDGDAWNKLEAVITDAITEHARALLADDVKREIGDALPECYRHWGCIHAFVDALRRKALGE